MQLPEKLERFSRFFIEFSESSLYFEQFEEKDKPYFLKYS